MYYFLFLLFCKYHNFVHVQCLSESSLAMRTTLFSWYFTILFEQKSNETKKKPIYTWKSLGSCVGFAIFFSKSRRYEYHQKQTKEKPFSPSQWCDHIHQWCKGSVEFPIHWLQLSSISSCVSYFLNSEVLLEIPLLKRCLCRILF